MSLSMSQASQGQWETVMSKKDKDHGKKAKKVPSTVTTPYSSRRISASHFYCRLNAFCCLRSPPACLMFLLDTFVFSASPHKSPSRLLQPDGA
jgi:hypothetical protein